MRGAYYNENDPFAAAWIRELIAAGHIAPGDVDDRSIEDVNPDDLDGYSQHHFFAGIGVWSLALRSAGWPDDRAIWTASCPCQPFSAAGKGGGFADERHLWPALHWLIGQCRPQHVIGEQVASKDGLAWLDLVFADLEAAEYAVGAVDTCAAGFGAPHIRQRLYWLADADDARSQGWGEPERERASQRIAGARGVVGGVAISDLERRDRQHPLLFARRPDEAGPEASGNGGAIGLADTHERQRGRLADGEGRDADRPPAGWQQGDSFAQSGGEPHRPHPTNGLWRAADWLGCRDGKFRPVEPGTFPLANAGSFRNRVALLRGAGNALNVAQAEAHIRAVMGVLDREQAA